MIYLLTQLSLKFGMVANGKLLVGIELCGKSKSCAPVRYCIDFFKKLLNSSSSIYLWIPNHYFSVFNSEQA